MARVEDRPPSKTVAEQLIEILKGSPGILTQRFEALAVEQGVRREHARDFLKKCEVSGSIKVQSKGRKRQHFWCGAEEGAGASGRLQRPS